MKSEKLIIEQGTFVRDHILTSDTFNAIYQEYTSNSLSNIVASEPHEVKKREFEYAKLQALSGFIAHMADLAETAHHIINPMIQQSDD